MAEMPILHRQHFAIDPVPAGMWVWGSQVAGADARQADDVQPMTIVLRPVESIERKASQSGHRVFVPSWPGCERVGSPRVGGFRLKTMGCIGKVEKRVHLGRFIHPRSVER